MIRKRKNKQLRGKFEGDAHGVSQFLIPVWTSCEKKPLFGANLPIKLPELKDNCRDKACLVCDNFHIDDVEEVE